VAEHALEVAHRIRRDVAPQTTGLVAAQLGEVRLRLGRPADAVALLQEAATATAKAEGPTSPRALARAHMLGTVYGQLERYAEAAATLRPVHAALGPASDPEIRAGVAYELGVALHRTGVKEEGLRRLEEALRLTRTLSAEHPALANRIGMMAQVHVERGRLDEAEGLLREAMDLDRRRYGDASAEVAGRYAELGQFLARYGRREDGIGFLDAACSLLRSTVGDADPRTVKVVDKTVGILHELAAAALARRDRELAVGLLSRATDLAVPVLGHGHERMRRVRELKAKHKLA
jgi:tetratricopeptide (TPR) repeat protein